MNNHPQEDVSALYAAHLSRLEILEQRIADVLPNLEENPTEVVDLRRQLLVSVAESDTVSSNRCSDIPTLSPPHLQFRGIVPVDEFWDITAVAADLVAFLDDVSLPDTLNPMPASTPLRNIRAGYYELRDKVVEVLHTRVGDSSRLGQQLREVLHFAEHAGIVCPTLLFAYIRS